MANLFADLNPPGLRETPEPNQFADLVGRGPEFFRMPETVEAPKETGDFMAGAKTALGQTVPLAKGLVGAAGAIGEQLFGTGGISTGIKNWGLEGFQTGMQKLEQYQKPNHDVTVAWEKAKEGDIGAMADFLQYALGYGLAQIGEAGLMAAAGALIGGMTGGPAAPATATAGAVAGAVNQGAIRSMAQKWLANAFAKEIAESGGKLTAQQAAKRLASKWGSAAALGLWETTMEVGSIFPEAVEQAKAEGRELDGADVAKVWGWGLLAGLTGAAADKLALDSILGNSKLLRSVGAGLGPVSRTISKGLVVGGAEAGTELVQTGMEQLGAGKPLDSQEAIREYWNAAAMGAVPGFVAGAVGGVHSVGRKPSPVSGRPEAGGAPGVPAVPGAPAPSEGADDPARDSEELSLPGIVEQFGRASSVDEAIRLADAMTRDGAPMTERDLVADRGLMTGAMEQAGATLREQAWDAIQGPESARIEAEVAQAIGARERRLQALEEAQRAAGQDLMAEQAAASRPDQVEQELAVARAAGMEEPVADSAIKVALDREVAKLTARLEGGAPTALRTTQLEFLAKYSPDETVRVRASEQLQARRNATIEQAQAAQQPATATAAEAPGVAEGVRTAEAPATATATRAEPEPGIDFAMSAQRSTVEPGALPEPAATATVAPTRFTERTGETPAETTVEAVERFNRATQADAIARGVPTLPGQWQLVDPKTLPEDATPQPGSEVGAVTQPREAVELASFFASLFGKEVVPLRNPNPVPGEALGGAILHDDGKRIFLNVDSPDASPVVIVGHELEHHMERDAPDLHQQLVRALAPDTKAGRAALASFYRYYHGGKEITDDAIAQALANPQQQQALVREFVADIFGNRAGEYQTMRALFDAVSKSDDPNLLYKVAEFIRNFIDTILRRLKVQKFATDQLVSDLEAAKKIVRDTMVEYAKRQGRTRMQIEAQTLRARQELARAAAAPKPVLDKHGLRILSEERGEGVEESRQRGGRALTPPKTKEALREERKQAVKERAAAVRAGKLRITDEQLRSIGFPLELKPLLATEMQYGAKPEKVGGVPEIALHLEERAQGVLGRTLDLADAKDRELLGATIAAEAYEAYKRAGNAKEWYDRTITKLLSYAALKHPELATDPNARTAYMISLAITSQSQDVVANLTNGDSQYEVFKRDGRFPLNGWGTGATSMRKNFELVNRLLDVMSMEELTKFFESSFTAGELKKMGFDINELNDEVVLGSSILGPKIGFGFYSNLTGNFEPVTMDMWFMRMIGRMTGKLRQYDPEKIANGIAKLRTAYAQAAPTTPEGVPQLTPSDVEANPESFLEGSEDDAIAYAVAVVSAHERHYRRFGAEYKNGTRAKSKFIRAAETLVDTAFKPEDAPKSGSVRRQLREVMRHTREKFNSLVDANIPPASIQALVWYPEQRLYQRLGAKLRVTEQDYAGVMRQLLQREGVSDELLERAERGATETRQVARATQRRGAARTGEQSGRADALGGRERTELAVRIANLVNRIPVKAVHVEVAPSPDNAPLVEAWNALPDKVKVRVSEQVIRDTVESIGKEFGAVASVVPQYGGWKGATNPSFLVQFLGNKSDFLPFAGLNGYSLSQQAVLMVSPDPFDRGVRHGVVRVTLPDDSLKTVERVYNTLWDKVRLNGEQIVIGHSTVGREMAILNTSPMSDTDFADAIDRALGGDLPVGLGDVYALLIEDRDYAYDRVQRKNAVAARASLQSAATALRADVGIALAQTLRREGVEVPTHGAGLAKSEQRSGLGGDSGDGGWTRRPRQPGAGTGVFGVHYGLSRVPALSATRYGTGIKGAEARRLSEPGTDPRIKRRVYFYLTESPEAPLPRPEPGLGRFVYRQQFGNIYDPSIDDDRIPSGLTANEFETTLVDLGYDGYLNRGAGMIVVLDSDVPVQYVGERAPGMSTEIVASKQREPSRIDITATPAFRKWFAGSKVVDADGRPLVVYRGLRNPLPEGPIQRGAAGAFHFTADPAKASRYARDLFSGETDGGNVVPVYLSVKNPYVIQKTDDRSGWLDSAYIGEARRAELEAQGFDGIVNHDAGEIIAFYPEQIKSAIGNLGTFDPNDPDILRSRQRAVMQDKKFRAWFKKSTVTDESGAPMPVYHSTVYSFEQFKDYDTLGPHFGTLKAATDRLRDIGLRFEARDRVEGWTPVGANILPVFLSMQKPLVLPDIGNWQDSAEVALHLSYSPNVAPQARRAFRELADELNDVRGQYDWSEVDPELFTDEDGTPRPIPDWADGWTVSQENFDALRDIRSTLMELGYDGIRYANGVEDRGSKSYIVFEASQVKSVYNEGTWSPTDDRMSKSGQRAAPASTEATEAGQPMTNAQRDAAFERGSGGAPVVPASALNETFDDIANISRSLARLANIAFPDRSNYLGDLTPDQEAALRVAGAIVRQKTLRERWDEYRTNLGQRLIQGAIDQFAPIKTLLGDEPYMLARMSKGSDGTLEAALLYGKPFLRDGVPDVNVNDEGFAKVLADLEGEHDRFMWWVAAQRARRLKAEGRENLLTDSDISALLTLDRDDANTSGRPARFSAALAKLNEFNNAILKIALDSELIDNEAYDLFKDQPYVPFYRVMADEGGVRGPGFGSGLVNQYAWKKLKGGREALNQDLLANLMQNWAHLLSASAKNRAAAAAVEAAIPLGAVVHVPSGTPKSVRVRIEGKEKHFLVEDPHLLAAISAIEYSSPKWFKPFSTVKRWLTVGVTANPAFKIRNLIRDSLQAIATADLDPNVLTNLKQGWKASSKESQTYASMLASGGMIRFGSIVEDNRATQIERMIRRTGRVLDETGWKKLSGQIGDLIEVYNELGDRSENVNRNALYEQLRAKGKSHLEASFMARDLMDFAMGGMWPVVRFLTQSVPFLNTRLQGLYKLGRSTKEDPKRVGYTVGAVTAASVALMLFYQDDEDWKRREDWDRDNYWWFKIGDLAFRIPKPFEVGAFGTLAERTLELMMDPEMTGKRYFDRTVNLISEQFAMNPTPQLVKPLVDLYANQDSFTGRPIESMAMQRLRPEDRAKASTSTLARALGSLGLPNPAQLANVRYEPLSPIQIDYLMRGFFGWLGATITAGTDYGLRPLTGRGERPAMQLRDVFLAGSFVETLPTSTSRYITEMYDQAKQAEQWWASYRNALKYGDPERAREIMTEHYEDIVRHRRLTGATTAVGNLGQQIRRIEASTSLSPETKRRMIDQLEQRRGEIAQRATLSLQ